MTSGLFGMSTWLVRPWSAGNGGHQAQVSATFVPHVPNGLAHDFTVGGTVQAKGGLYIARAADEQLLQHCRNGDFAYVLTARQMGKSSLMVRTAQRLAEDGVRCAQIDLTQIGVRLSAEQWYLGLITFIADQLKLNSDALQWWQARAHLGNATRLSLFLQEVVLSEVSERVVIFVDEIDSTLSLDFTDDFFAAIRSFYNARAQHPALKRLSFVLIGVATPGDLIQDPYRTPFNVGHRVELTDFAFDEALPLARRLGLSDATTRAVLEHVLRWTGGHPYLTQRVFRAIAQRENMACTSKAVEQLIAELFFGDKSETDNNLQFVRDMLTKRTPEHKRYEVLHTYLQVWAGRSVADEEQSLVKTHLKLAGIVCRRAGRLELRNSIYRQIFNRGWVQSHMRVNWSKRLKWAQAIASSLLITLVSLYAVNQRQIALEKEKVVVTTAQANRALQQARAEEEEARKLADAQRIEAVWQSELAQRRQREAEAARQSAAKLAAAERAAKRKAQRLAEAQKRAHLELAAQTELAKRNEQAVRIERERADTAQKNVENYEAILRRSGALTKK